MLNPGKSPGKDLLHLKPRALSPDPYSLKRSYETQPQIRSPRSEAPDPKPQAVDPETQALSPELKTLKAPSSRRRCRSA